jgi:hypothetical protein
MKKYGKTLKVYNIGNGPVNQNINQLVDNLFRHEYGKIVSALTKFFGTEHIQLAEDVVQDSLIQALNDWPYKGVPYNPQHGYTGLHQALHYQAECLHPMFSLKHLVV